MKNRLPERLKQIRGPSSQRDFAASLGVKQTTYSRWELGQTEPPFESLMQICSQTGVSSDWLLGLSDERSGGGVRVTGDGNAVASASPGARLSAAAPTGDMERLLTIIESQQKVIARLAGVGKGEG